MKELKKVIKNHKQNLKIHLYNFTQDVISQGSLDAVYEVYKIYKKHPAIHNVSYLFEKNCIYVYNPSCNECLVEVAVIPSNIQKIFEHYKIPISFDINRMISVCEDLSIYEINFFA